MKTNANYRNLQNSYLFSNIAAKVKAFGAENPEVDIIRLGIGDVTQPLAPAIIEALHKAVDEQANPATFAGYGNEPGYDFLREKVAIYLNSFGAHVDVSEVFISDGAKSDLGNFLDLTDPDVVTLIPDPVYPAYLDTNIMHGHPMVFAQGNAANGFTPAPDYDVDCDLIYICSPNNPTGATYDHDGLKAWVDYALAKNALILFDSAYESFIRDANLPHTIYEIEGAEKCAVEISSFSKRAGFTGLRAGFTVVPNTLTVTDSESLNRMWNRRQGTKYNGVPYIVQRAAEAALTPEGLEQTRAQVDYYLGNARIIADMLDELNIPYTGGHNSPYIWMACPDYEKSWDFFDDLLNQAGVVGTPGAGFGAAGEGYFRLTGFGERQATQEAVRRIKKFFAEKSNH